MDFDVPPPAASPRLPVVDGSDGKTPAHGIPTVPFIKAREAALLSKVKALGAAVGLVATGVVAVIFFFDNRVAAQVDAGQKVHEARISTLETQQREDKVEASNRMTRIEQNQNADHGLILDANQKLDALLRAQGVHNPAPTPKDGGQ